MGKPTRWLVLAGTVTCLTALTLGLVTYLLSQGEKVPDARITEVTLARVQPGMTLKEVIEILRVVPGDYSHKAPDFELESQKAFLRQFNSIHLSAEVLLGERHFDHHYWIWDEGLLWVCVNEDDVVVMKHFMPRKPTK